MLLVFWVQRRNGRQQDPNGLHRQEQERTSLSDVHMCGMHVDVYRCGCRTPGTRCLEASRGVQNFEPPEADKTAELGKQT